MHARWQLAAQAAHVVVVVDVRCAELQAPAVVVKRLLPGTPRQGFRKAVPGPSHGGLVEHPNTLTP